jgi:DNA-directed RNA polymerase subunit M/transcription elongation factor TFIIS
MSGTTAADSTVSGIVSEAAIRSQLQDYILVRVTGHLQSEPVEQATVELVKSIERGIFNWTVDYCSSKGIVKNWRNAKFRSLYLSKARGIIANLSPTAYINNTRLLVRLLENEFAANELAYMKPENMFPEVWKNVIDLKMLRDQYCEKPEAMTDQYRCGRCKKRECVYQEIQLRSADEPMSLFITCLNCGNRWRMG